VNLHKDSHSLLDWFLLRPAGQTIVGRKASYDFLRKRYAGDAKALGAAWNITNGLRSWDELPSKAPFKMTEKRQADCDSFATIVADKYHEITTTAIRKADPNHMVLGYRYYGIYPPVLKSASKYVDVIDYHFYEAEPPVDILIQAHNLTGLPIMVSEFGCRASDSGALNTVGAGPVYLTQMERVACYKRNAMAMLKLPFMIGYHMFAWVDEPGAGNGWHENSNYGLVHLTDEPYLQLTAMFSALNHNASRIHSEPYSFPPAAPPTATAAAAAGDDDADANECTTRMSCRTKSDDAELSHKLSVASLADLATADPLRVNKPPVPSALEPMRWGAVQPAGWLRDWALAARHGAGSPTAAAFARIKAHGYPPFKIPAECRLSVDGWRHGRAFSLAFYDEDSAYSIDGMTRLGAVLRDKELVGRVKQDFEAVLANPDWFNATWTKGKADGGSEAEDWVRSIYSRCMLAYYDYTRDKKILAILAENFLKYRPEESSGQRSLTQIEAMLESHAYGAPAALAAKAITIMTTQGASISYQHALLGADCVKGPIGRTAAA